MTAPDHDPLVRFVQESTHNVLSTMFNLEPRPLQSYVDARAEPVADGVVSLIGLAGEWAGTGSIYCSAECACKLSSEFLGMKYTNVDDDVLDAIAELTNMIIGNVKTQLEECVGPLGLSIPTVVYGRNFSARTVGNASWTVVPFELGSEQFHVQICLAANKSGMKLHAHPGHVGVPA